MADVSTMQLDREGARRPLPESGSQTRERSEARWRAVQSRDPQAAEAFVYAVRSTGIFCRPTCPSRRPRRDRVEFFDSAEQALGAGYRACRRCRPEAPDPVRDKMLALCRYIETRSDAVPTLAELGARAGMSPAHLQRTFKRVVGVSPRAYADARRAERLRRRLRAGDPVLSAGFGAGFGSASRLYAQAPDRLGMTPARFRAGGAGEQVRYAIVRSPLGHLLVAATERGLCSVALGANARELRQRLRDELPEARRVEDEPALRPWIEPILQYLEGERPLPDLPLDVQATAFQRRVWQALREIPPGQTQSYAEVARRIAQPHAARAVARACARNPAALLVPWPRVVRQDGSAGDYRWGAPRKRALLKLEREPDGN
jgi:AraC family transcriptional regulator of adaptative response/methylated-DNA-[protein]-cysteine methyltransferase